MAKEKTKIFSEYGLETLEKNLNEFLEKDNISIIKINNIVSTQVNSTAKFSILVIYTEMVELNKF